MTDAIRAFLAAPRAPRLPERTRRDWLLVAVVLGLGVLEGLYGPDVVVWRPAAVGLAGLFPLTLLWRRAFPLAMVAVAFGAASMVIIATFITASPWSWTGGAVLVGLVLTYALARWGSGREVAVGLVIVLTTHVLDQANDGIVDTVNGIVFWLIPAALGATIRHCEPDVRTVMSNAIKSWLSAPRAPDPPERSPWDLLLVALLLWFGVLEGLHGPDVVVWRPAAVGVAVLLPFTLLWRRTQPLASVAVGFGAVSVVIIAAFVTASPWAWTGGAVLVGLILTYALARWGSGRETAVGLVTILAISGFGEANELDKSTVDTVIGCAFWLLPAVFGFTMAYRADVHRRRIEEARMDEREQLARELHDAVAHHVSAIAIQAQAARVVATSQPETAVDVLKVIEEIASSTLTEMRKIVGALRDTTKVVTAPQQCLADIERIAGHSQSGPRIDVSFSGKLDSLDPSVETGLYRIAQESITNARRHARHASCITVRVYGADDSACLTVTDDGDIGPPGKDVSPGYGLTGMKERATLLGGQLEAGPNPDGGWQVRAVLPNSKVSS